MIPPEIPEGLRASALPVLERAENEAAWDRESAKAVIEALFGTKLAILTIEVYAAESWGLVPVGEEWACVRPPNETATDFAKRSRGEAREFIETHDEANGGFYALGFSVQQDAA